MNKKQEKIKAYFNSKVAKNKKIKTNKKTSKKEYPLDNVSIINNAR